jgi:iron-sulfur cluster insertion protein
MAISITERAAKEVLKVVEEDPTLVNQPLRLLVRGGGCAGFSYDLHFEENPTTLDEVFEERGVKMVIDPLSFQYLDGTEIDFVEGIHASGFKFNNPNVTSTCGCGSSFSV